MPEDVICPYNTAHRIHVNTDRGRLTTTCPTCNKEVGVFIGQLKGIDYSPHYNKTKTNVRLDVGETTDAIVDVMSEGRLAVGTWNHGDTVSITFRKGKEFPKTIFNHAAAVWYDLSENDTGFCCFIATAAYGTPFAPEIDVLREFRDRTLSRSYLGTQFVSLYYSVSPPIARFIETKDRVRGIVRWLLKPVVWCCRTCMRGENDG